MTLGKIDYISLGYGGYDDAMFGLSVTLTLEGGSSGVGGFEGTWAPPPSKHAKWTREDQLARWGGIVEKIRDLCKQAKVKSLHELRGIPVACEFDGNMKLISWRILTEVL